MKMLKLNAKITKTMKIIIFHQGITKIMKITQIHMRITQTFFFRISLENQKSNESSRIHFENHENHESL